MKLIAEICQLLKQTNTLTPKLINLLKKDGEAPQYTTRTDKIHLENPRKDGEITLWDIYGKPSKSQKNPNPTWNKVPY